MRQLRGFETEIGEHDDPKWGWDSGKPYVWVSDQTKPTQPPGWFDTAPHPPPDQSGGTPPSVLDSPKPQGCGEAQIDEAKAGLARGLPAVWTESLVEGTCSPFFPSALLP